MSALPVLISSPRGSAAQHLFSWDGKDAFGRTLEGVQPVTVSIGYVYPAVYMQPAQMEKSFAAFSNIPITGAVRLTLLREVKPGNEPPSRQGRQESKPPRTPRIQAAKDAKDAKDAKNLGKCA